MRRELEPLRERLLHAGVAAPHADRYVAELGDHLDDLAAEEQSAGRSAADAHAQALRRLGDIEALAASMIARREFQAWGARAPIAVYVVAPSVILTLATAFWVVGLVAACMWIRQAAGAAAWTAAMADGVVRFGNLAVPVILGWALGVSAIRQRTPALWPMLGLIALAAVGAALQVEVTLPLPGAHGEVNLRPAFGGSPIAPFGYWGRLILDLALTTTPYVLFRQRRAAAATA